MGEKGKISITRHARGCQAKGGRSRAHTLRRERALPQFSENCGCAHTRNEGRTTSPTGRAHPNRDRRNDVRKADLHNSISYYATYRTGQTASTGDPVYAALDNDRKMKEASFSGGAVAVPTLGAHECFFAILSPSSERSAA